MSKLTLKKAILFLIFIGLLVIGCDPFSDDNGVHITTDKNIYYLATPSKIELSVDNQANQPVYFICAGEVWLQELDENQVVRISWQVHGFEKCLAPRPIDVGKSHTFELPMVSEEAFSIEQMANNARFNDNVRYRFLVDLYQDVGFKNPLQDNDRLSNQFLIIR